MRHYRVTLLFSATAFLAAASSSSASNLNNNDAETNMLTIMMATAGVEFARPASAFSTTTHQHHHHHQQQPSPPFWPQEFTAVITDLNTTSNVTQQYEIYYSYNRNATIQSIRGNDAAIDLMRIYADGNTYTMMYTESSGLQCETTPLSPGDSIEYPAVNTFAFNGTILINKEECYLWVKVPYAYATTMDTNQYPVSFVDASKHEIHMFTAFSNMVSPVSWPLTLFLRPIVCSPSTAV